MQWLINNKQKAHLNGKIDFFYPAHPIASLIFVFYQQIIFCRVPISERGSSEIPVNLHTKKSPFYYSRELKKSIMKPPGKLSTSAHGLLGVLFVSFHTFPLTYCSSFPDSSC